MKDELKNLTDEVKDSTTVEQVDVNIDEIFGIPGAENVMLPEDDKPKSMFSKENIDSSFLDMSVTSEEKKEKSEKSAEVAETIAELDDLISQEEDAGNKGRPKVDKSGLYELAQKMIEDGALVPFDDDKDLEEYTTKDFRELFEANFQERENKIRENTPREFFQSLPEELQVAAKYVADGGTDLKGLFRTLAHVEEMRQLDPDDENDQSEIARQYLWATNFGTAEEIEQEIQDWQDMDKLPQKANQFKPKLDAMQEKIVARELAEQEVKREQQSKAAQNYTDNVYNTLLTGDIGGIKLDKKTQSLLYSGLVQPNYPSISGKPTNLLGHLLEKYQFVEPRHDLIAEALWLLADPDGYKNKVRDIGAKESIQKTVRQLKTEEGRKLTNSSYEQKEEKRESNKSTQKTISRSANIFKRF
ncbi:MAG TPA: hypothetical protein VMX17_17490 [Candidatus Glassbacteria bacterium]|jgi:hypothetical protein|nr:hypothetical protein [Candidatus Glassbacteria bacterium]